MNGKWYELSQAMGYDMHYNSSSEIMDDRARDPDLCRCFLREADRRPRRRLCNSRRSEGTPIMHVGGFVRGLGRFMITEFVPTTSAPIASSAHSHHGTHPRRSIMWGADARTEMWRGMPRTF
jgi:predicted molibdopterin-dependent oxidoreductase YjgC